MPSSGLNGPYRLSNDQVDAVVSEESAGAYALGETREKTFYVSYVGRSDKDVNDRLKDHVGDYKQFKYRYYSTVKGAFEKECRLYHDFEPPNNKVHPDRPTGKDWECPVCDVFDE